MSPEEKLGISCIDFVWDQEHKSCSRYLGSGVCLYGKPCLEAVKRGKGPNRRETFSYSQLATFLNCPRQYYYSYELGLEEVERPKYYEYGTFAHAVFQALALKREIPSGEGFSLENTEKEIIKILCEHGVNYFADSLPTPSSEGLPKDELKLTKKPFIGFLDLLLTPSKGAELKFLGSLEVPQLAYQYQLAMYFYLQEELEEILLYLFKKPALKLRKDEEEKEYLQRVSDDIARRPHTYFVSIRYLRDEFKELLDGEFETLLSEFLREIGDMRMRGFWRKNPRACRLGGCAFMTLCVGGIIDTCQLRVKGGDDRRVESYAEKAE
jgi:CRISPR/Cas system-associated exonuclease Cas4 (RecB family)